MTSQPTPRRGEAPASAADRPYHHGNLRGAILDAALDVLSRKEPSELSLRDLARTVGVRHSALYVHFRDRGELLAVIAGEGFKALASALRRVLEEPEGDALTAISSAYLRFARSSPAYYRTMYRPENVLPENIGHVEEVSDACFQILVGVLSSDPAMSREEAIERGVGIWSTLHGLVLLGENSGPLHQKIAPDREPLLADKFVQVLARGDWPGE